MTVLNITTIKESFLSNNLHVYSGTMSELESAFLHTMMLECAC